MSGSDDNNAAASRLIRGRARVNRRGPIDHLSAAAGIAARYACVDRQLEAKLPTVLRLVVIFVLCIPLFAHAEPPASAPARIAEFQGEYRFLSNFWPATVEFEGIRYPTAEHAYQAAKTLDAKER